MPPDTDQTIRGLCLECGLCCDGTLFHDVRLRPGEDPESLRHLGLKAGPKGQTLSLRQPCPALNGTRCEAYAIRPCHCREFTCLLFQSVQRGETEMDRARAAIRSARKLAQQVRGQLSDLEEQGKPAQQKDLRRRFASLSRRMETSPPGPEASALFGELTVAFHRLNVRLRKFFLDE